MTKQKLTKQITKVLPVTKHLPGNFINQQPKQKYLSIVSNWRNLIVVHVHKNRKIRTFVNVPKIPNLFPRVGEISDCSCLIDWVIPSPLSSLLICRTTCLSVQTYLESLFPYLPLESIVPSPILSPISYLLRYLRFYQAIFALVRSSRRRVAMDDGCIYIAGECPKRYPTCPTLSTLH